MEDDQQFCLRWNNHQSTLIQNFDTLLESGTLVDCTLATEGKYLKAHKVVLSACSPFFEVLLSEHYDKHPVFILKDVKFKELKAMMDYMYRGEVNISQDQLAGLLKAAESLQIKGLSESKTSGSNKTDSRQQKVVPQATAQPTDIPHASSGLTIEKNKVPRQGMAQQGSIGDLAEDSGSPQIPKGLSSREGSQSPTSRKRKRFRRRSIGDDNSVENHEASNSSDMPQQMGVPALGIAPVADEKAHADSTDTIGGRSALMTQLTKPADEMLQLPLEKPEPNDNLIEPKSEYLEDPEESVEDLTLDDDMNDLNEMEQDNNRAGPSHDPSQHPGIGAWHVTGDRSNAGGVVGSVAGAPGTTDEVFLAAQEAAQAHRDSQGIRTKRSGVITDITVAVQKLRILRTNITDRNTANEEQYYFDSESFLKMTSNRKSNEKALAPTIANQHKLSEGTRVIVVDKNERRRKARAVASGDHDHNDDHDYNRDRDGDGDGDGDRGEDRDRSRKRVDRNDEETNSSSPNKKARKSKLVTMKEKNCNEEAIITESVSTEHGSKVIAVYSVLKRNEKNFLTPIYKRLCNSEVSITLVSKGKQKEARVAKADNHECNNTEASVRRTDNRERNEYRMIMNGEGNQRRDASAVDHASVTHYENKRAIPVQLDNSKDRKEQFDASSTQVTPTISNQKTRPQSNIVKNIANRKVQEKRRVRTPAKSDDTPYEVTNTDASTVNDIPKARKKRRLALDKPNVDKSDNVHIHRSTTKRSDARNQEDQLDTLVVNIHRRSARIAEKYIESDRIDQVDKTGLQMLLGENSTDQESCSNFSNDITDYVLDVSDENSQSIVNSSSPGILEITDDMDNKSDSTIVISRTDEHPDIATSSKNHVDEDKWMDTNDLGEDAFPFRCEYCTKRFKRPTNLSRHKNSNCFHNPKSTIHSSEETSFICKCGRRFKEEKSLVYHRRHDCEKFITCPICKITFTGASLPSRHLTKCTQKAEQRKQLLKEKQKETEKVAPN
ncbi:PREDICTED: uncharacterized protein LOC108548455 isoform X2 [Eufriesea mexicana]|uniref:uncharacterized protein LOC108548455 isoform X2 n=1 Tax=Eufriesea mexicana TaxID=516756 RepID=UPI00083BBFE9|nr:PREDICTED: uncharacterized protein LOC108548455 isoform X2 [Eufriesea mexicana]